MGDRARDRVKHDRDDVIRQLIPGVGVFRVVSLDNLRPQIFDIFHVAVDVYKRQPILSISVEANFKVFIPTISPARLSRGPPLLPGLIAASC